MTRGFLLPDGWILGLLVPAETQHPCALRVVPDSSVGLSDTLGGALLDENALDGTPTHRCWLYLDVFRHASGLPPNDRLHELAAALGWPADRDGWRGPALLTGRTVDWADRNIPSVVVAAALRAGLPL